MLVAVVIDVVVIAGGGGGGGGWEKGDRMSVGRRPMKKLGNRAKRISSSATANFTKKEGIQQITAVVK